MYPRYPPVTSTQVGPSQVEYTPGCPNSTTMLPANSSSHPGFRPPAPPYGFFPMRDPPPNSGFRMPGPPPAFADSLRQQRPPCNLRFEMPPDGFGMHQPPRNVRMSPRFPPISDPNQWTMSSAANYDQHSQHTYSRVESTYQTSYGWDQNQPFPPWKDKFGVPSDSYGFRHESERHFPDYRGVDRRRMFSSEHNQERRHEGVRGERSNKETACGERDGVRKNSKNWHVRRRSVEERRTSRNRRERHERQIKTEGKEENDQRYGISRRLQSRDRSRMYSQKKQDDRLEALGQASKSSHSDEGRSECEKRQSRSRSRSYSQDRYKKRYILDEKGDGSQHKETQQAPRRRQHSDRSGYRSSTYSRGEPLGKELPLKTTAGEKQFFDKRSSLRSRNYSADRQEGGNEKQEKDVSGEPSDQGSNFDDDADQLMYEEYWRLHDMRATNEGESPVEQSSWQRSSPADLFYVRDKQNAELMIGTQKLKDLHEKFGYKLIQRAQRARAMFPSYEPPARQPPTHRHPHKCKSSSSSSSSDSSSSDDEDEDMSDSWKEIEIKKKHPYRLHTELWYNDPGEVIDGPLCRCSYNARKTGIRHCLYPEEQLPAACDRMSNNSDKLFHYRVTISPHKNFLASPTVIVHDDHEYMFEGFSVFSHYKLEKFIITTYHFKKVPKCKLVRFNIEYTIHLFKEPLPENFTVAGLELLNEYLMKELLEMYDFELFVKPPEGKCTPFHVMPRFVRELTENGKEILSVNEVMNYLLQSSGLLTEETDLSEMPKMSQFDWECIASRNLGYIATYPGKKPCSLRIDQLDRDHIKEGEISYPTIVHFGVRPSKLCYVGDAKYQESYRQFLKYRHILANKPKVTVEDKEKFRILQDELQALRSKNELKRDVCATLSSEGFHKTGIKSDVVLHAILLPVVICHIRFHKSLDHLESSIGYKFKNRSLLQLALTHASYRTNYGNNPDHARNTLSNCGIRTPEYGEACIQDTTRRKRGINFLIKIMSLMGSPYEMMSAINHNERLEFLGDAVVEFITTVHLFFLFPGLDEGGLTMYRSALVQNQHLAILAKKLRLNEYMLYAHGPDLCHDFYLRHAMANCFEALMGALLIDSDIKEADRVFTLAFLDEPRKINVWQSLGSHPLQQQEPDGDRHWIDSVPILEKLTKFEESVGVKFTHIRLLAMAFTLRNVGYNHLTIGHNQRLEFLGDTVLQLVASEYLYKHFPRHHEGHLSLLRSSLVNSQTQAQVCDDLGMMEYVIKHPKYDKDYKVKDRADLLEAFLGALYVDKDLEFCEKFCEVCFFPRLRDFILRQRWNDPKSKLQQCCLTLRMLNAVDPDIPIYKVVGAVGPTNARIFTVAVYFRGRRLGKGSAQTIQLAEMNAATNALQENSDLFPQLKHQRKVIVKRYGKDAISPTKKDSTSKSSRKGTYRRAWERKSTSPKGKSLAEAPKRYVWDEARTAAMASAVRQGLSTSLLLSPDRSDVTTEGSIDNAEVKPS